MKTKLTLTILFSILLLIMDQIAISQEYTSYSKIAVDIKDPMRMQQLVDLGLAVDHYEMLDDGSIAFYAIEDELETLNEEGIPFNIIIKDYNEFYDQQTLLDAPLVAGMQRSNTVANGFDLGSMGGFYTYAEVEAKLDEMKMDYPNLITTRTSIGTSIEGREIWMAKISDNPTVTENEPKAYFDALHHAREPLAMATTINFMFWLLENYGSDPQVTYLVDNREIYFVPVVNPDGYEYNRQTNPNGGGLWRKNRNPNDGSCVGVDLNRNYAFGYANNNSCSSPDPCSGVYRGTGPFSEPESSAVRDFMAQVLPKTAFSTHSTAGSYLMPYGYNTSPPAFEIYSEWASVFLSENDYPYGVTFQMLGYTSCGTTRDFMHSEGIYGWTPEIDGSGFWPPQSTIFDLVGENVFPLFYQSWIAGAFVDVQSHELGGNAIPGETMELTVEVKNVGVGATAENVIVEVTPSHPGITVSVPQSYGSVAPRSRADNLGTPFEITLDPNFTESSFELTLVTTQDGSFNDQMVLTIQTGEKEVLYFDNAENGDSNWISSGTGILWSVVFDDAYSGTQCFGDSNGGNGENNTQNSFELLPTFDFSGAQQPAVSFVSKYSFENGDRVDFQLSLDAGISWQTLDSFEGAESWHEKNYLLQNLQGQASVNFRFTLFNDSFIPADGFYFDDFEVANYTNGILGDSDFDLNVLGVSPNPFSGQIVVKWFDTVDFALIKVGLFDLHGRAIDMKLGYGPKKIVINGLENLSSGLYFLRIKDPVKGQFMQKIIKQ